MTTAQYRKSAQEAERLLIWYSAACLWEMAIAHYPPGVGHLRRDDIAKMQRRADACYAMAKQEGQA